MKKYIGFMVVGGLIFSLLLAGVVRAEEGKSDNTSGRVDMKTSVNLEGGRQEDRNERQEDRGERREDRQAFRLNLQADRASFMTRLKTDRDAFMLEVRARKEEWKNDKADRKAQFCQAAKEAFTNRFEMAISKLETYQGRVGEIIITLNAEGKDTAEATVSLNLSKQKLADAKDKLAEIKALVPDGGCENMTPEIFEKIKVGAREAKDLLKESRQALHEAIQEIRSLKGEVEVRGDTSVNVKSN